MHLASEEKTWGLIVWLIKESKKQGAKKGEGLQKTGNVLAILIITGDTLAYIHLIHISILAITINGRSDQNCSIQKWGCTLID